MLELVVSVCLVGDPKKCSDVTLNFDAPNVSARECAIVGQFELAKWIGDHPQFVITKWRCGPAGEVAKL